MKRFTTPCHYLASWRDDAGPRVKSYALKKLGLRSNPKWSQQMMACRVMVVAEDPSLRNTLVSLLEQWHFEVFPAADNVDALRQVYQVSPQIVVTDIELTSYAGFEWLPFLRQRFPKIDIVAISRNKADASGKSHKAITEEIVVIEPLDPESLRKALHELRGDFPVRQEFSRKNSSSASGPNADTSEVKLAPLTQAGWTLG